MRHSPRRAVALALGLAALVLSPAGSGAQTTIVVSGPQRKFPIALPQLCQKSGSSTAPSDVPTTIGKDLNVSGFFDVLSPNAYVETPGKCVPPDGGAYQDWSVIRAEWLVRGEVTADAGRSTVRLYLHDVPNQRAVVGKEYSGDASEIPLMAHKFANEILRYVTGEAGPFGSKIAFSSRTGRFKDLFVMDMDGSNTRQLTNEHGLALSPSWSPDGRSLLYTSYRSRVPDLFLLDVASGRSRSLTKGPSLEVGGTFVPGGRTVVTSVSDNKDSSLVEMDLEGRVVRRLTPANRGIDVSPSFSPDGAKIAFCSDRAGKPQIYVTDREGGGANRVSFVTSDYCTSPSWSPKGDRIAFVCRADGGFQLFVAAPDGGGALQLTAGGDNEDPEWSPDGRFLVYSTTTGGRGPGQNLAVMRVPRGSEPPYVTQVTFGRGSDSEPAWGPVPG